MDDSGTFAQDPAELNKVLDLIKVREKIKISYDPPNRNFVTTFSKNNFFYASKNGGILSIDIASGNQNTIYKHYSNIDAGLASDNKHIYFIDNLGYVVAISLNGSLEWKSFVGEVFSPPLSIQSSIIIRTSNQKIISLNKFDGSLNWTYQGTKSPLTLRSWGELNYLNDTLYIGAPSGKLLALNYEKGTLLWEISYSQPKGVTDLDRSNDTTSKPLVIDQIIYAISSKGNISAISSIDGVVLWSRPLSSFVGMINDAENLFITHNSGSIYCLNKDTGKVLWRNAELMGRDLSKGLIIGDIILYTDFEGYLHFINKKNGKIIGRTKLSDSLYLNPILLSENSLFISSLEGDIYNITISIFDDINSESTNSNKDNEQIIKSDNLDNQSSDESILDSIIFWD